MSDTQSAPTTTAVRPGLTMRSILAQVCADHRLREKDLIGPGRVASLARARQDFMWRARQVTLPDGSPRYSLSQIGTLLGGRDHTTVLHGVGAHARRIAR